jgi:cobalt/nickel transport system permease protein
VLLTDRLLWHAGALDDLALRSTPLGRIDPRAKVLVTLAFVVTAASFGRDGLLRPIPLLVYLAAAFALGDVPLAPVAKRIALLSPFAILAGAADLLLHRTPSFSFGPFVLSEGAVSFASLLLRFVLCAAAVFLLAATTRFAEIVRALRRLGMPRPLATQLLLAHRYFFVLGEEAGRMVRAHALRVPGGRLPGPRIAARLLAQLLLRSLGRAERLFAAMACRGFDGDLAAAGSSRLRARDVAFVAGWCAFFVWVRTTDTSHLLGTALTP